MNGRNKIARSTANSVGDMGSICNRAQSRITDRSEIDSPQSRSVGPPEVNGLGVGESSRAMIERSRVIFAEDGNSDRFKW